MLNILRVA